jgi:sortase A
MPLVDSKSMSYPTRKLIRKRSKLMRATGVTGELLVTAGALMGLFLTWHLVLNDSIQGHRQNQSAMSLAQEWEAPKPTSEDAEPAEAFVKPSNEEPHVTVSPEEGRAFALLYVPRFGADFVRTIAEGVDVETVLNSRVLGVGRYLESDQLGNYGNFALAAHRTTFGAPFGNIGELRMGDQIYVEVPEGWHAYEFRNLEYVWETDVKVLNSFPKLQQEVPGSRVITLTSCHPKFTVSERVIAYGLYSGWYPREGGAPNEIAELVKGSS